jgi:hypothetical protein
VLPVRVGGTEYRQSTTTPASVLGFDQALCAPLPQGAGTALDCLAVSRLSEAVDRISQRRY